MVFKKSTAVHLFFYMAGFFLFGVGEIYNTLTLLAIVTNLSFQFLYGLVAASFVHVATEQPLFIQPCATGSLWTLNSFITHRIQPLQLPCQTTLSPFGSGLSFDALVFKLVCDKATTVHKISTNMKKMSKAVRKHSM
ncbi:hypothetical protein BBI10_15335 [Pseudomonas graminis]|uniref:Uncharacterized protein n=1 Tax=Pseudomonas graminis TaxID=158627 RepID=A0A1C2DUE8_9PSED|nr:hypothetical protein BBI10_15335 [Pseudomonas graminis]